MNVGDKILYDRFPGHDAPVPGTIDSFQTIGDKNVTVVICSGIIFLAPPNRVKLDTRVSEFNRGVFYAAYLVCELHDNPTIAADMIREANLDGSNIAELDDTEKETLLKLNASEKLSLKV